MYKYNFCSSGVNVKVYFQESIYLLLPCGLQKSTGLGIVPLPVRFSFILFYFYLFFVFETKTRIITQTGLELPIISQDSLNSFN